MSARVVVHVCMYYSAVLGSELVKVVVEADRLRWVANGRRLHPVIAEMEDPGTL